VTEALHAEWTKLRTASTTNWLLLAAVCSTVAASAGIAATTHISHSDGAQDPIKLSLTGVDHGQAVVAILAVLAISEEYDTGMIRLTLAAVPRRLALLAAKATNVAALGLAVGLVAIPSCLLIGRLMLPADGVNPSNGYALISFSHGSTVRAAGGTILYLALIALLGLGIATVVRDTAVSIGVVLAILYVLPIAAQLIGNPTWRRHLQQIAPLTAGLALQATTNLHSLPVRPWIGLAVVTTWATAAIIAAALSLRLRDA
jgi:ABC-2 type transport system permease protein